MCIRDRGKLGQFAVDAGVAGTQLAGDMGFALLTGGSALVPMALRGFGSGAQEARQAGASYGQQLAYGLGSAALSTATEKILSLIHILCISIPPVSGEGQSRHL